MEKSVDIKNDQKVMHVEDYDPDSQIDYKNNAHAKIRNPLGDLSHEALSDKVSLFVTQYGFEDKRETFRKAAFVAQRPNQWESVKELDEDDRYWLAREISHKWSLPWQLYMCIIIVCCCPVFQSIAKNFRFQCELNFERIQTRTTLTDSSEAALSRAGIIPEQM